jgi:hypothetical protein
LSRQNNEVRAAYSKIEKLAKRYHDDISQTTFWQEMKMDGKVAFSLMLGESRIVDVNHHI